MKPGTLLRLALAGTRTDRLRVLVTAFSSVVAALVLMAAATVAAIPELGDPPSQLDWNGQYSSELLRSPYLRPQVIVVLLTLAIPVLALAGQCIRLGTPARDRRLAAIRLAGATPRQAVLVAGTETALASLVGTVSGLGAYAVLRLVLHRPGSRDGLVLPTDVLPASATIALIVLGVPLAASLLGAVLLRRVIIAPLGVVRRARTRPPRLWPGLLLVGCAFPPLLARVGQWLLDRLQEPWSWWLGDVILIGLLVFGVALPVLGVVVGTAWITHQTGRLLHRFGRRPAMLLAAQRLITDPWHASRTQSALLAALVIGAGILGLRAFLVTEWEANAEARRLGGLPAGEPISTNIDLQFLGLVNVTVVMATAIATAGVMVALLESIVSRRRAYAALVATGVPRRTLSEAIAWQALAPVVPAVLVALTVGVNLIRTIGAEVTVGGWETIDCAGSDAQCADPDSPFWRPVTVPGVVRSVPLPLAGLSMFGVGALAAMCAVVAVGVLFLRVNTDVEELRAG